MQPSALRFLAEALRRMSVFAELSMGDLERILGVTSLHACPGRSTVFRKGQVGDALYIVHRGAVDIVAPRFLLPRRRIARLGPGDAFGEMALLSQPYRTASAIAVGDTELFVLKSRDFNQIFSSNPAFLASLQKLAAERRAATA